jgi:hypothetical protein
MTPADTTPETPALRPITIHVPPAVAQKLNEWHEGTLEDAALTALRLYHGMGAHAYAQLRALAQTRDTSPAKALRDAIEQAALEADAPAKPNTLGRPVVNQSRDASIYAAIKDGNTYARVATLFNLSVVRVGQIVAHQREINGEVSAKRRRAPVCHEPTPSQPKAPEIGSLFDALDSGMTRATAAQTYTLTVEQVNRAYAAYKAELPPHPSRGDRVSATFAGLYALEDKPEPRAAEPEPQDKPQGEKVLSLEDSKPAEPPRKLVIIPPSMRNPQAAATPTPTPPAPEHSLQELQQAFDNLMGGL